MPIGGWVLVATAMVRKATASMARVDPPVSGGPAANLMLVQAGEFRTGLEVLLRTVPAAPSDPHQSGSGTGSGGVAALEGQFPTGPRSGPNRSSGVLWHPSGRGALLNVMRSAPTEVRLLWNNWENQYAVRRYSTLMRNRHTPNRDITGQNKVNCNSLANLF